MAGGSARAGTDIEGVAAAASGSADTDSLASYLKALANAKRLRLLHFLAKPHYLEEIASELKMARQTAQEHVEQLLGIGVIQRMRSRREHGPVTDYVVVPQRLFAIHEALGALGQLEPEVEASPELRPATQPLKTGVAGPKDELAPRLTIVHGMRIGRTVTLTGNGPWLLGRDPHASVCLDYDPFVSTRHAEVRRDAGQFTLADLYSSNGTWLDWKRVPRGGAERIDNGSVVRVGKSLILFRRPL